MIKVLPDKEKTTLPVKPAPPKSGSPEHLLEHAERYGVYVQELEQKILILDKWRASNND